MEILSRKVRYALHGLAYLASHPKKRPTPFNEILRFLRAYSDQLTLSNGYLAKIFQEVSRAGFAVAIPRIDSCGFHKVVKNAENAFYGELEKASVASIAATMDFRDISPTSSMEKDEETDRAAGAY